MYELIPISERSFYIQSPSRAGLFRLDDTEVCLIDSGNHEDAAKKILKINAEHNWKLAAVFNTHAHADHIGGNRLLAERTGCRLYAPGIECAFARHPILEPAFLYGGFPPADIRRKFLLAEASGAEYLTADILPAGMEMIDLPGHFFGMVGFRTPDDAVYLADCLSSREILDKYGIGFVYDVKAYLETLEKVKSLRAKMFVPAHAEPTDDIAPLAEYNIVKTREVADRICDICREPMVFEELLKKLCDAYGIALNFEQYVLIGSTVRSYLVYLRGEGRIQTEFAENRLLWQSR
ncbi:MAG: MBL fold metallo-hydrolase [Lentisphaeria bacterium]|nr:MBL fold metallo-hydrolase [Lentisphaeria bacterium]